MEYKKPICNCGKELKYFESFSLEEVYESFSLEEVYEVSTEGWRFKKPSSTYKGRSEIAGLGCKDCEVNFEADVDHKNRLVRGSEI